MADDTRSLGLEMHSQEPNLIQVISAAPGPAGHLIGGLLWWNRGGEDQICS